MNQSTVDPGFINQVASSITRFHLQIPARLFLSAGHPVTFLGSQLLWVSQPALGLFVESKTISQTAHLLEDTESVAALIAQLEAEEAKN